MGLTFIAIVLLVAAWAALLLPDFRNRRRAPTRRNSIATFSRQLSVLERTRPGHRPSARVVAFPRQPGATAPRTAAPRRTGPRAPSNRQHARIRRQRVLVGLVGLALCTLALGVVITPLFLVVHVLVDLALAGYVWMLVEHQRTLQLRAHRPATRHADVAPMRRRAAGS